MTAITRFASGPTGPLSLSRKRQKAFYVK